MALTAAGLYGAYVAFVMIHAGAGSASSGNASTLLLFFCWAISPVAVLAVVHPKNESSAGSGAGLVRLIAVGVLVVFGAAAYQEGFFGSHLDAQNGLLFVFVPLYQWAAALTVLVLLAVISGVRKRRSRRPTSGNGTSAL